MPIVATWRSGYLALALAACAAMPATGAELTLPCQGPEGRVVAGTTIKAIREDFSGKALSAPGKDGRCRIQLPAGTFWVKAEAPGMRSVPVLAINGSAPGRELRLVPLIGKNAEWSQWLQRMSERDQAVRNAYTAAEKKGDAGRIQEAMQAMNTADREHREQLAAWLKANGFPRAEQVGYEGVHATWLLLQHAPDLMVDYLADLRAAAAAGELARADLALSEDRLLVNQGKPQRYGSQLREDRNGKPVPYPLESPEKVDVMRAKMDLGPLVAYLKLFGL